MTNDLQKYITQIIFNHEQKQIQTNICFCHIDHVPSQALANSILHPHELSYYKNLKHDKRKISYFLGRFSAKNAINSLYQHEFLNDILIDYGVFGQPLLTDPNISNINISITHSDKFGVSIAFPTIYTFGIDIEKYELKKTKVLEAQMTQHEIDLIHNMTYSYNASLISFWTIKEALSKALKTGLSTPAYIYEIDKIITNPDHIHGAYKNFPQYHFLSILLREYAFSLVYPSNMEIITDISKLKSSLDALYLL